MSLEISSQTNSVQSTISSNNTTEKLHWLHTDGCSIVDELGKKIILRGINLGGFLIEEMWMMPFETNPPKESSYAPIKDHVSLWNTMEKRFGNADMVDIRQTFRRNWITDHDFDKIKATGFNSIRLPFIYDLTQEPEGLFSWIDWTIERAHKAGMYVILDLHGTPGRQSNEQHTGQEKSCTLFSDFSKIQATVKLWTEIAERYKDRPEVAGYDLINEPMSAQNHSVLYVVYEKLYTAIRKVDQKHIIFMEDGFKDFKFIPSPAHVGWENVSLSAHAYAFKQRTEDDCFHEFERKITKLSQYQKEHQAPLYLGEFNVEPAGTPQTIDKILSLLEKNEISWSFWMYKIVTSHEHRTSMWGLYSAKKSIVKIDPYIDSKDTIIKKIKNLHTDHLDENTPLTKVFRKISQLI